MKNHNYTLFALFLILPNLIFAQHSKVVEDFRFRSTMKIEKDFLDKLTAFGEFEIGLEQDVSRLGKIHTEFGVEYEPIKYFSTALKYRFAQNRKNYSQENKFVDLVALSVEGKYKIDRIKTAFRIQYQTSDDEEFWNLNSNQNIIRTRLKGKYNIRKSNITPFAITEFYSSFGNNGMKAIKLKSTFGMEYRLNKEVEFEFYYRIDQELTQFLPYLYHTGGISVNILL